ncbi:hypothetical protein GOODEAATRI_019962 [Goodea atripinnis]|uniref:Uncharacterized protein n=1 Tax=Goodea atripinnis TaxID=208336 RepID=A0ABV0N2V1_9TELE
MPGTLTATSILHPNILLPLPTNGAAVSDQTVKKLTRYVESISAAAALTLLTWTALRCHTARAPDPEPRANNRALYGHAPFPLQTFHNKSLFLSCLAFKVRRAE